MRSCVLLLSTPSQAPNSTHHEFFSGISSRTCSRMPSSPACEVTLRANALSHAFSLPTANILASSLQCRLGFLAARRRPLALRREDLLQGGGQIACQAP